MAITSDLYNIRVRLDEETRAKMVSLAEQNRRSLAAEIRVAVDLYLKMERKL